MGVKQLVEFGDATAGETLAGLTPNYSELRSYLFNRAGKLRVLANVYLNDEGIRQR